MDLNRPAVEQHFTLLGVRADGFAPFMDLLADAPMDQVAARARTLLAEHASCSSVEVWRDGILVDRFDRA